VQAEGLKGTSKGKEDKSRGRKDTQVQMQQAAEPQKGVRRGTRHDFLVLAEKLN
jgi:hypothetical protein